MKQSSIILILGIFLPSFSFNLVAQEVPPSKKELRAIKKREKTKASETGSNIKSDSENKEAKYKPNSNSVDILDNLINQTRIVTNGRQITVHVKLRWNHIEFKYEKVGTGVKLISIEEISYLDNKSTVSNFIKDALNKNVIANQKAKILPNTTAPEAIKKMLKPVLIQPIAKKIDAKGSGKGLFWTDNFVYVGDIKEGRPNGIGKQINFDNTFRYEGQVDATLGWHGQGKALLQGDTWEGKFKVGLRTKGELYKVYHVSPRTGDVTISEGYWDNILYKRIGLWHIMNPNGSIEEMDLGPSGNQFKITFVKHADVNGDVNSFNDISRNIRSHLNQFELYLTGHKKFNISTESQLVYSNHELESKSEEYYFIVFPKGTANTPGMKFSKVGEPGASVDIPLEKDEHYSKAFGYPVYLASFATEDNDVSFDIHIKGTKSAKAMLLIMGAKSAEVRFEPAPCTHGYVK